MQNKLKRNSDLIIADTREELLFKISNGRHYVKSDFGSGFVHNLKTDDCVRVYNIHKRKQKHEQIDRLGQNTIKSKKLDKLWYGYAYNVEIKALQQAGLKVVQGVRNFTFLEV